MKYMALVAVFGLGSVFALATEDVPGEVQPEEQQSRPATQENKKAVAQAVASKAEEAEKLRQKANDVTTKIGELASSGKLTSSDEAVKTLQELVQELAQINEQLKKMQDDISDIKGWIEGQNEGLPVLVGDVEALKRVSWGNYLQFQWADTQEGFSRRLDGSTSRRTNSDGFQLRRVRMSTTNRIDPRTTARLSVDFASGSNRLGAELKDAQLIYDIEPSADTVGTLAIAGQQAMPLGYELQRSSSEREMPERAIYNRVMFNGERNRGVQVRHGIPGGYIHAGLWNSLTVNDPQLNAANTFRNLSGTEPGFSAGIRQAGVNYDFGLAAFTAERPRFSYTDFTTPDTNATGTKIADSGTRSFIYADGNVVGVGVPELSLRAEAMFGRDRVPTLLSKRQAGTTISNVPEFTRFTNMIGWQIQATYNINYRNQFAVRYEFFDPDTSRGGDDLNGIGLSYIYYLNPGARLMIAHEMYKERVFELRNNVTTIRVQFRL